MERRTAGASITIETDSTRQPGHAAGALANPASGLKITIIAPNGTVLVNEAAMTNDGTGLYSYIYQTAKTAQPGVYQVLIDAIDTTYSGRKRETQAFEITP